MKKIPSLEITRIRTAIKRLLKNRGLNYSVLAKGLGVSQITIKRYMTKNDFSIAFIAQLAAFLGMRFDDFMRYVAEEKVDVSILTQEQDEYLASHPGHCAYMNELRAGHTPLQIERRCKLKRASTERYLLDLERIGILEYHSISRVKLKVDRYIDINQAPCIRREFQKFVLSQIPGHFIKRTLDPGESVIDIALLRLSNATYKAMKAEINAVATKFSLASHYESRTERPEELQSITLAMVADVWQDQAFQSVITNIR